MNSFSNQECKETRHCKDKKHYSLSEKIQKETENRIHLLEILSALNLTSSVLFSLVNFN